MSGMSGPHTERAVVKWWGWGLESKTYQLDDKPQFWPYLQNTLKLETLRKCPCTAFERVRLPPPRIEDKTLARLKTVVGASNVSTEKRDRLMHSLGKSYLDLLCLRRGVIRNPPDVVVYPGSEEEVEKLLGFAGANRISVVPFAGGSSVVGGVEPTRRRGLRVVTIELRRMNRVLDIDAVSLTASVEAGTSGPELEDALNGKGFTLGHFPQSFQFSALGGWIATRSAGQLSTKYGKIEDMVESLTLVSPSGRVDTKAVPASASGPELKQVLIGSEGVLGVITRAKLRIRRLPEVRRYEGLMFKSFRDGINAVRETMQGGLIPTMMRLSDPDETRVSLVLSSQPKQFIQSVTRKLGLWLLKRLGYLSPQACMMILGIEGAHASVKAERHVAMQACKRNGAFAMGSGIGRTWLNERFELPYLRDVLLDHCILVDTLETATTWDKLEALHEAIKESIENAMKAIGVSGLAFAHVSHAYRDGASVYFTFLAPQVKGKEAEQWLRIKKAATDCIMRNGGTLSHHHGIGKDHAPWIRQELGVNGLGLLKAMKRQLDPEGIMNPGKLLQST